MKTQLLKIDWAHLMSVEIFTGDDSATCGVRVGPRTAPDGQRSLFMESVPPTKDPLVGLPRGDLVLKIFISEEGSEEPGVLWLAGHKGTVEITALGLPDVGPNTFRL